jgi:hypothetical protein
MNLRIAILLVAAACGAPAGGNGGGDDTMNPDGTCTTAADCPTDLPVCLQGQCVAACATGQVNASFVSRPSDIIWVVDQSGSMDQETAYVQAQINMFAASISASMIDYRVTMIASPTGGNAICVPAPLGGAACGNNTLFRLVDERVGSNDGPALFVSEYSRFSDFLRLDATKHIIFVTDDNSDLSANQFKNQIAALAPANMFASYKVHAIYAYGMGNNGCDGTFGEGAADGTVYTQLVSDTMGARGVICNDDWTQVLTDISAAVVSGSQVACEIEIPAPSGSEMIDPSRVNVTYQAGGMGAADILTQVSSAADCAGGDWYYDDNAAPTKIVLCPTTCSAIQADDMANVKIQLGCSTQIF